MSDGYNGWANWETWNLNLWVDNEFWSYSRKVDWMRHLAESEITDDSVEYFIRQMYPKGTPDFDSPKDFDAVDFGEIAEHWRHEKSLSQFE